MLIMIVFTLIMVVFTIIFAVFTLIYDCIHFYNGSINHAIVEQAHLINSIHIPCRSIHEINTQLNNLILSN